MTKPIRMRLHSRADAIDLVDYDAGDLEPVDKALLGFGAKKILSVGNPLEETQRYSLGSSEVILDWDGYTSALRTTDPTHLTAIFNALSRSPLFEVAGKDD
ncbi:hypothetical protein RM53_08930 [Brevundimonas nasdae]|uniref:Uncharacterized protein n=1 Tax=Brevundimonas nasdae TaxID=172043 RepID=A0A0B4CP91_9CAUL|nr:hypothetical protein [Brevundimonas nasdae]KIC58242.1 hypothetical protein RM53_08930 [Brevundimonas nasdae]